MNKLVPLLAKYFYSMVNFYMQWNESNACSTLEKLGIRQVPLADDLILLMRSEFRDINSD